MNNHSFLSLPFKFISIYFIYSVGFFIFNNYFLLANYQYIYEDNAQVYELLIFMVYNQIKSLLTNGTIYFLIAIFFTQKYRLTSPKKASIGSGIGVLYCILLFLVGRFLLPQIYPLLNSFYYHDRVSWNISVTLLVMLSNILLLLLVFRLFKPKSNTSATNPQFAKKSVQKAHATILSCFMLLFLLLPMMFIDHYQYLLELIVKNSFIDSLKIQANVMLVVCLLINFIVIYKVISSSTCNCFNGVIDKIRWGALFIAMILSLIIMAIISYVINSFFIYEIINLNSLSEILTALLISLFVAYLALGLSCRFAVKILFRNSLPPSEGIVS